MEHGKDLRFLSPSTWRIWCGKCDHGIRSSSEWRSTQKAVSPSTDVKHALYPLRQPSTWSGARSDRSRSTRKSPIFIPFSCCLRLICAPCPSPTTRGAINTGRQVLYLWMQAVAVAFAVFALQWLNIPSLCEFMARQTWLKVPVLLAMLELSHKVRTGRKYSLREDG